MAKLQFKNEDLRKVMEHNKLATIFRRSFNGAIQEYEKQTGKKINDFHDIPKQYYTTDKPLFWLVKDEGIYLMTGGILNKKPKDHGHVAYAKGYHPDKNGAGYDRCKAAVGGDDFVEEIDADILYKDIEDGCDIIINLTATKISVAVKM